MKSRTFKVVNLCESRIFQKEVRMYKGTGILSHLLTETKLVRFHSILKKTVW